MGHVHLGKGRKPLATFDQRSQIVGVQNNPGRALDEAEERELFDQFWRMAERKGLSDPKEIGWFLWQQARKLA